MGKLRCEYNWQKTGQQVWFDGTTFETLITTYPNQFVEEFHGSDGGDIFDGTVTWKTVDVGDATEAIVANKDQFLLHLHATSEAEDAVLYFEDELSFDVGNGLIFEAAVDMAVSPGTGVAAVFGMAGPHNLDKDTIANHAWFRFQANLTGLVESDDTTNNNDDIATGLTAVAGTRDIYRIDFTTLADVKFYVNGARVAAGTTFDMSNLSAAEQQMQPYFSLDKASGTGLGDMNIEYVKIFSNRS